MNKVLLFVLCAFVAVCAAQVQQCKEMHPVVLMPGVMGTVLHATADIPMERNLPDSCPHQFTDKLLWIDPKQFIKYTCLKDYFESNYNPDTDSWERIGGINFTIPNWGSTYAVDTLAPGAITSKLIPYYHKMIKKLESIGYVDGENLIGAGYDWKEAGTDKWVDDLTILIEKAVKNSGSKAVLIGHSMGGPYSYFFLMKKGEEWIKKNIHMYIPMAPAWMGAVKALDVLLNGIDREVPIAGKYFAPLVRHIPGVWFLLPREEAFPNMILATSPSKNYSFGQLKDLLNDGTAGYVEGKIEAAMRFFKEYKDYEVVPPVPVRAFVGRGEDTVLCLNFKSDIRPHDPDGAWEFLNRTLGDGDGTVPTQSATYVTNKWINEKKGDVQVFTYDKMSHLGIIKDDKVIEDVIGLFCE